MQECHSRSKDQRLIRDLLLSLSSSNGGSVSKGDLSDWGPARARAQDPVRVSKEIAGEVTQDIIAGIDDGRVVRKGRRAGTVVTGGQTSRYEPRLVNVRTRFWFAAKLSGLQV